MQDSNKLGIFLTNSIWVSVQHNNTAWHDDSHPTAIYTPNITLLINSEVTTQPNGFATESLSLLYLC